MDWNGLVPKDKADNVAFRSELRAKCKDDIAYRNLMTSACKEDVLFFFNAFCWLYEPRPKVVDGKLQSTTIPFITWPHQDHAVREIAESLGFRDIGVEKSRGEGMSWIACLLALHDWLFDELTKVGLVSSTEKKADNPEDPDSLFWKIDWELTKLPFWMAGKRDVDWKRSLDDHTLVNKRNQSVIAAYSATGNVGRGGRYKWFLMDELGSFPRPKDKQAVRSTQHATNCRVFVSTPEGSEGAYFEVMHMPDTPAFLRLVLDWKQNPTKNRGLYRILDGKPVAVDAVNNPLPAEYADTVSNLYSRLRAKGFKLEDRDRSPWYDNECDRVGATPQSIAQELDRDYGGAMFRAFGSDFFDTVAKTVQQPVVLGNLTYHPDTHEYDFDRVVNGPFQIWCPLDHKNQPPRHQYAIGCDVASGLGGSYTSNSTMAVIDMVTKEQVAEFASNVVSPGEFADLAIAVAKWFHDAYLAWEANGPGGGFSKRILKKQYSNIYMRTVHWRRGHKKTKEAGWWTDERTKEAMMADLAMDVKSGALILRSKALQTECGQYVRKNGKIVHVQTVNTVDDSSKGAAHGDRVIAIAVANQALKDRPLDTMIDGKMGGSTATVSVGEVPKNTMAARDKAYKDSLVLNQDIDGWDDRTLSQRLATR